MTTEEKQKLASIALDLYAIGELNDIIGEYRDMGEPELADFAIAHEQEIYDLEEKIFDLVVAAIE